MALIRQFNDREPPVAQHQGRPAVRDRLAEAARLSNQSRSHPGTAVAYEIIAIQPIDIAPQVVTRKHAISSHMLHLLNRPWAAAGYHRAGAQCRSFAPCARCLSSLGLAVGKSLATSP